MLACARIGAVHSVVFGGFGADALAGRLADSRSRVLLTADGAAPRALRHDQEAPRRARRREQ